ncbi:hypothetical protein GCM10011396_35090 [Undibacterium terreum]|uniref:Uncharacterized protein n=1 Tax=Undibacterium terreum TaxID=1224302 RepID=A0A916URH3_9BURK|nr:hypothetical protein GCM10011396_35090 [Undibacterium terreum]
MTRADIDFRQTFSKLAPQAIVSRSELAILLSTTEGAISQMAYRGELPITAFPSKRRACWFASDIRQWLDSLANNRHRKTTLDEKSPVKAIGRPRFSTDLT